MRAGGTEPLGYQWFRNGVPLEDGGNIAGALTSTLAVSSVSGSDAGSYSVVFTNAQGSCTSAVAVLTVLPPERFVSITLESGGRLRTTVVGPPERSFTLQRSPDSFHWADLGLYANRTGTLMLTNDQPAGRNACFYRTVFRPGATPPAVPAPSLSGMALLADGRVRFRLESAAGTAWRVEGSPDLIHWGNYGVVTNPSGSLTVTNTPVARPSVYFYRVVQP